VTGVNGRSNPPTELTSGHLPFELPDFRAVFEKSPGLYLILDAKFTIVGASDAYCGATMTVRAEIIGRGLFEVFPDNPDDSGADGVANLRDSLLNVIKFRRPDRMGVQKYDIRRPDGVFEERHWSPLNTPVLGPDGYVRWIVHAVEDVTELITTQREKSEARRRAQEQERAAADLRHSNAELVEKIALLRASLKQLSSM
jgi:PAS domain-containing protein